MHGSSIARFMMTRTAGGSVDAATDVAAVVDASVLAQPGTPIALQVVAHVADLQLAACRCDAQVTYWSSMQSCNNTGQQAVVQTAKQYLQHMAGGKQPAAGQAAGLTPSRPVPISKLG
jgi:hypothetical protein